MKISSTPVIVIPAQRDDTWGAILRVRSPLILVYRSVHYRAPLQYKYEYETRDVY